MMYCLYFPFFKYYHIFTVKKETFWLGHLGLANYFEIAKGTAGSMPLMCKLNYQNHSLSYVACILQETIALNLSHLGLQTRQLGMVLCPKAQQNYSN